MIANHRPATLAGNSTLREPLLAIVIPVYKQPEFLKHAVLSAVRQTVRELTKIVIVNDGCPYSDTDWIAKFFRDAYPEDVFYLKQPNGGVAAARNHGIRFAMSAWPSIQAIFPLDSDNKLSPFTLERLWERLSAAGPEVGWIYQDLHLFGRKDEVWECNAPFSVWRMMHQNFCDSGSLIHRRVFDSGVWFDEEIAGYEDWEFFIHAAGHGFRGLHAPDTEFFYRVRRFSRNVTAESNHDGIYSFMQSKHADFLSSNNITLVEHGEAPRFALVDIDNSSARYLTDALDGDFTKTSLVAFADDVAALDDGACRSDRYVPPIVVFGRGAALELLDRLRLLPGVLFSLQKMLRSNPLIPVAVDLSQSKDMLSMEEVDSVDELALYAMTSRQLYEDGKQGPHYFDMKPHDVDGSVKSKGLRIGIGETFVPPDVRSSWGRSYPGHQRSVLETINEVRHRIWYGVRHASTNIPVDSVSVVCDGYRPHAEFAAYKHLARDATTFPRIHRSVGGKKPLQIVFAAPWIGLGGVDACILQLARELARANSRYRISLLVTERNEVEANVEDVSVFDTISFLPTAEYRRNSMLLDILSAADVVINAHSRAAYQALPELKERSQTKYLGYLHTVDFDKQDFPAGYPVLAAREFPDLIDHFLVISHQLRRFCKSLGVPDEKIHHLPNAPTVVPSSVEQALGMAEEKSARRFSAEHPVKLLFSGRFDHQKGIDRLARVAELLRESHVPLELTMVGKQVLSARAEPTAIPNAVYLPSTSDKRELARHYADADVFLLPSRWEGVPLAVLEAMAFGDIVVATDVGAIGEVMEHQKTGFLIDTRQAEDDLAVAIRDIVVDIVRNPVGYREMRLRASRTAMEHTWTRSARNLAALIEAMTSGATEVCRDG